jgi:putative redox protein
MELLLAATGGCTAFDVVTILKKGRHKISDCRVGILATRADHDPKVFTKIHFEFVVSGTDLKRNSVVRAIELSKEKFCSASIMLSKTAEISYGLTLIEVA